MSPYDFVIVPCSKSKVWDRDPDEGCVPAVAAYTGAAHRMAMEIARLLRRPHYILSAKYGLLRLNQRVCRYNVSFSSRQDVRAGRVVSREQLRRQLLAVGAARRGTSVLVLGSRAYADAVRQAAPEAHVMAPLEGLTQGRMLRELRQRLDLLREEPLPTTRGKGWWPNRRWRTR